MLGLIRDWLTGKGATKGFPPTRNAAPPMPTRAPVTHKEEWLTVASSGIAHRFAIIPESNQHYRYSICGFESQAPRLKKHEGERKCVRCLAAKGW